MFLDLGTLQAIGPFLSAAGTTTLALLTFFAVRASRSMAREMYESRLAHFRPLIYVVLKPNTAQAGKAPALFVRNVGPGPAMDIDILCEGALNAREHITFLGPGHKLELPAGPDPSGAGEREVLISVRFMDIFNNPLTIRTVYRYEEQTAKELIFPDDTMMEGETVGCRQPPFRFKLRR